MKNKYAKRARISEAKIREIVRYVAADLTALQAAALSGLNRNTVNRLYRGVRERMLLACEAQRRLFGVVEVDESFFGARRVKGRRGRGAYGALVHESELARNDPHPEALHLPISYDSGPPRSVIRFRMLHASSASALCPPGVRARRPVPMIDLYLKKAFSTRACRW